MRKAIRSSVPIKAAARHDWIVNWIEEHLHAMREAIRCNQLN